MQPSDSVYRTGQIMDSLHSMLFVFSMFVN